MQRPLALVSCVLAAACSSDPVETHGSGGHAGHAGGSGGHGGSGGGHGGCESSLHPDTELPELLSASGIYADINNKTVAPSLQEFAPRHELWSDAADKTRWVYLPECETIDTSAMNDWSLPVGTRFWKEFRVGDVRVETRLIERVGAGPHDFRFAAYVWDSGETEAVRTPLGAIDANGTTHDVPSEDACRRCHGSHEKGGGRPSRALGFSALQLSGAGLDALVEAGKLSDAPDGDFVAPGDAIESAALGYLHANCGHCHNTTVDAVPQVDLDLWLDVGHVAVADTGAYSTAVGVPNTLFNDQNVSARIEPGDPAASAVSYRMNQRGNVAQMPPVASELVDDDGVDAVSAWIAGLP